jgi:hypothetical protein
VNDVTNLCQEVVAQMTQALDQFQRAAQANCPSELPALPESLLVGVD